MTIKTFRAPTLREAIAMVRAELGDGAAVLHAREVSRGRLARIFRPTLVEVAATPDHSPLAAQAAAAATHVDSAPVEEKPAPSPESIRTYARLLDQGFTAGLARSLVDQDPIAVTKALASRLAVSGPIVIEPQNRRVAALVGPTGVGKTTTIAKLAANFRLRDQVRVGLITVDTYRVGAVEQLKTYAEIIDLPMQVVATPAEMRKALDELQDVDLVLIDTAGRSPRDAASLQELRSLLEAASPDEIHLALSASGASGGWRDAWERFESVSPTSLLITKIDESPTWGHLIDPLLASRLPVSYLTDGQSVPEDIRVADAQGLATIAVEGTQR